MNTKLLKQKILDLAIRGKLVPQDPNDEPASELLKRIRAEKEKLIAEGKIKRSKKAGDKPHYENVNAPFEVPDSWEWVRLDEICDLKGGKRIPKGMTFADCPTPHIYIRVTDMKNNTILSNDIKYIDEQVYDEIKNYTIADTDLYLTIAGTIGAVGQVPSLFNDMNLTENAAKLTNIKIDKAYLMYALLSSTAQEHFSSRFHQVAQPKLSIETASSTYVPLPPSNEQSRIAKRIKEVFGLIDSVEVYKQDLQELVKQSKRKVLDLAILGKLVPQDSNDEPAIELLKRINPAIKPCDTSHYENLPKSWCICKLKDVFDITMGSSPTGDSLNNKHEGIEFHQGKLCFSELYLNKSEIYTDSPTKLAEKHSILLCVRAPVGVINITEREICIGRGLCSLKPKNGIDFMFAFYALQTHKSYFEANATGTTFKAIGGDTIRNEMFALPPYDEQVRIRKKIESLFYELDLISAEL